MKPSKDLLDSALDSLLSKPCWLITGGSGAGSALAFHFGDRVPRTQWLTNPTLTVEARQFEGEAILYVECPWRIESPAGVIVSWLDAQEGGHEIMNPVRKIEGEKVARHQRLSPANDLILEFAGGHLLRVFCDQSNPDAGDNYTLFTQSQVFTNAGGYTLAVAPRARQ